MLSSWYPDRYVGFKVLTAVLMKSSIFQEQCRVVRWSQPTFRRNISPPSSGSKNEQSKKPTWSRQQAALSVYLLIFVRRLMGSHWCPPSPNYFVFYAVRVIFLLTFGQSEPSSYAYIFTFQKRVKIETNSSQLFTKPKWICPPKAGVLNISRAPPPSDLYRRVYRPFTSRLPYSERGSSGSHSLENSVWTTLWTCRKTDSYLNYLNLNSDLFI
jgi:hypothetical protein